MHTHTHQYTAVNCAKQVWEAERSDRRVAERPRLAFGIRDAHRRLGGKHTPSRFEAKCCLIFFFKLVTLTFLHF